MYSRCKVVDLINSWIGKNKSDGSYKSIIDIYNSYSGKLPRGIKMEYGWRWCACTVSAVAIKLGYTNIIPIEISCGYLIDKAKEMGIWVENDGYVPKPADIVLYDWDDSGKGDNTGWPDHVGYVTYVNKESGYFEVTEGNYSNSVKKRTVSLNGKYIRGFIVPKYDDETVTPVQQTHSGKTVDEIARECISGKWGNGEQRKKSVTAAGYDYDAVQARINAIVNGSAVVSSSSYQDQNQPVEKQVTATCGAKYKGLAYAGNYKTTANLHLRNDAGTNKKSLCLIPKGTKVRNYGYYNKSNGAVWLYIEVVLDGVRYTGFSHKSYLTMI